MLRRRIRAFLTILELVYHATTGKGIHDASQINDTLGRTVYDEAQTPSLSETEPEPLNESWLSASHSQGLSFLQVDCTTTTMDYVLNVTYLFDLDSLKTRDTLRTSGPCLSVPPGTVDSLKGLAHLDGTSDYLTCPISMDSHSLDTLGAEFFTNNDPSSDKYLAIGKQFSNSRIVNLRLVILISSLSCLISRCLVVAFRQRGFETCWKKFGSLRKAEVKGYSLDTFLSGMLETMELVFLATILTMFGRSMLCKVQLNKAGRTFNLVWDVLHKNWIQQRNMMVDDCGSEDSPSYTDELENSSEPSLKEPQDESCQSFSAPPSESDGFVTAMSIMSHPNTSILSIQPSASFTSSNHAYHSSVSTFEGTPPPSVNGTLPVLKSSSLDGASNDTSYIDVNEVVDTAPPCLEGSIRTLDPLDENLFAGGTSHIFLTRLPCSDHSRKFVFRHTVCSMSPGYEFSLASELSPALADTASYVSPGETDFATTKSPLQLVPSCPSSSESAVLRVSIGSPSAASPYSRLRAEFNGLLNPNEPQYLSPHLLPSSNRQPEDFTPKQSSAAAIGPFDGAKPVKSWPQFLFTSPVSALKSSGLSDSPGPSFLPENVPGPIRSKSSTFFVNTCVRHSERLVREPILAQTPHNPFVLKTRRDLSSYGLMARNSPSVHSPTSSAPVTPNPAPHRQGSLLENKFTLPPFHLNL